MHKRVKKF